VTAPVCVSGGWLVSERRSNVFVTLFAVSPHSLARSARKSLVNFKHSERQNLSPRARAAAAMASAGGRVTAPVCVSGGCLVSERRSNVFVTLFAVSPHSLARSARKSLVVWPSAIGERID
jgi:hypothetical protein